MKSRVQIAVLALCIAICARARAQVTIGNDLHLTGSGDVGLGYGAGFGDTAATSHDTSMNGSANFNGYYYNPQFLSFSVQPYVNRNQNNSDSASIDNANGVISTANIFSGSRFPTSFTYTRQQGSTQLFGLPNGSGFSGDGSSQYWSLGSSLLLPDLPTLSATFMEGKQRSSAFGVPGDSSSNTHTLNLTSAYRLAGFSLNGGYVLGATDSSMPAVLTQQPIDTSGHYSTLTFSASHRLPWAGNLQTSASRMTTGNDFTTETENSTSHTYSTYASFLPGDRVGFTIGTTYNDNLFAALNQSFINQGIIPIFLQSNARSDSLAEFGNIGIRITKGLSLSANATHSTQHYGGTSNSDNLFSGTLNYSVNKPFLRSFTFMGGVIDTSTQEGHGSTGLLGAVNYQKRTAQWTMNGSTSYSHSIQTIAGVLNTSMFNYTFSGSRKLSRYKSLTGAFYGSHTGVQINGGSNHSESFNSTYNGQRFSVNASWGESRGYSILTSNGLQALSPTAPLDLIPADSIVTFNGTNYGFGAVLSPRPKCQITVNYNKSTDSTVAGSKTTFGDVSRWNGQLRYPWRKMYLNAGVSRVSQSLTTPGANGADFTTYFFGISRWFNFF